MAQPKVKAQGRDTRVSLSRDYEASVAEAMESRVEDKSFAETFDLAADRMWLHRLYGDSAAAQDFQQDKDWRSTEEQKLDVINRFDESYHEYIFSSTSEEEFQFRIGHSERTEEASRLLAEQGFTGVTASIAAAVTDPALIPTYFIPYAGLVGNAGRGLGTGARIWKYAKAGMLVSGAEGLAVSSLEYALRPDADVLDILYGTLLAAGAGGTISGIAGGIAKRLDKEAIEASGLELTEKGKRNFKDTPSEAQAFVNQFDEEAEALMDTTGSVGAARVTDLSQATRLDTEENLEMFADTPTITTNIQDKLGLREKLSSVVRAARSENGLIRELAMRLGQVSGNTTDDATIHFAASTEKQMLDEINTTAFYEAKRLVDRGPYSEIEFNQIAARALRGDEEAIAKLVNDSQREFVETIRQQFKDILYKAKELGVEGFKDVNVDDFYLPRQFNWQKLDAFARKNGWDKVDDLFEQWIIKANDDGSELTEEAIDIFRKVAKGYRKSLQSRVATVGVRVQNEASMAKADTDIIRQSLIDEGLDDDVIDKVMGNVEGVRKQGDTPQNLHGRQRLRIDETSKVAMPKSGADPYGNPKDNPDDYDFVSLQDFLHDDIEFLFTLYSHRMSASMAMTKAGIGMEESFETLLKKALDMSNELGIDRATTAKEMDALRFMYESTMGNYNLNEGISDGTRNFLRQVRELNFIRLMGQAGLAATIELSNVVMENGIRTTLKVLPQLRKLVKRAEDGKLDDQVMREITAFTGIGGDVLRSGVTSRLDNPTDFTVVNDQFTRLDRMLGKGRKFVSIAGGLAPITTGLSRLNARLFTEKFVESFKKGKKPFSDIKLKQLGLNDAHLEGIKEQFNRYASFDSKGKLIGLNADKWDNPFYRDKFFQALRLDTTQNVQVTNIGSTNPLIRSEVGKTAFQFMSYVLGSNEQQFGRQLARLQAGDKTPIKIFMGAMVMGYLTYVARVQLNSVGRDDRKKYMKERMDPTNVARGILSYYGGLGIFSVAMSGGNPETLINNPTAQLATGAYDAVTAFNNGEITESELRNMLRLLPMQNVIGINQGLNTVAAELGE